MTNLNWNENQITQLIKQEPDNTAVWELIINLGAIISTCEGNDRKLNLHAWTYLLTKNSAQLQGIYNLMPEATKEILFEGIQESATAAINRNEYKMLGVKEAQLKAIRHLYKNDQNVHDYSSYFEMIDQGIPESMAANLAA